MASRIDKVLSKNEPLLSGAREDVLPVFGHLSGPGPDRRSCPGPDPTARGPGPDYRSFPRITVEKITSKIAKKSIKILSNNANFYLLLRARMRCGF